MLYQMVTPCVMKQVIVCTVAFINLTGLSENVRGDPMLCFCIGRCPRQLCPIAISCPQHLLSPRTQSKSSFCSTLSIQNRSKLSTSI